MLLKNIKKKKIKEDKTLILEPQMVTKDIQV